MIFWRTILNRVSDTGVWLLIGVLFTCSLYFTWDVQTRRGAWRSVDAAALQSGTEVQLVQVIDGDEVSVSHASGTFVVRILGIKAFDPNLQDPGISSMGLACVEALTQMLRKAGPLRVVFEDLRFDKAGRLLAYLELNDLDVGARLVSEGLALAYTRYSFSREAAYVQAQAVAKNSRAGLWLNPKATQRAEALIQSWKSER